MTKKEKRAFIKSFIGAVERDLLSNVDRMPEDWNGHEIRRLIADKFEREVTALLRDKRSRRYKDFESAVITHNL